MLVCYASSLPGLARRRGEELASQRARAETSRGASVLRGASRCLKRLLRADEYAFVFPIRLGGPDAADIAAIATNYRHVMSWGSPAKGASAAPDNKAERFFFVGPTYNLYTVSDDDHAALEISFQVEGGAEQHRTAKYTSKLADLGPMADFFPPGQAALDFTWLEFTRLQIDGASLLDEEWVYNRFQVLNPPVASPAASMCVSRSDSTFQHSGTLVGYAANAVRSVAMAVHAGNDLRSNQTCVAVSSTSGFGHAFLPGSMTTEVTLSFPGAPPVVVTGGSVSSIMLGHYQDFAQACVDLLQDPRRPGALLSSVGVSVKVSGTWDEQYDVWAMAEGSNRTVNGSLSSEYYVGGPVITVPLATTLTRPTSKPLAFVAGVPAPSQTVARFTDPHDPSQAIMQLQLGWDGTTACLGMDGSPYETKYPWGFIGKEAFRVVVSSKASNPIGDQLSDHFIARCWDPTLRPMPAGGAKPPAAVEYSPCHYSVADPSAPAHDGFDVIYTWASYLMVEQPPSFLPLRVAHLESTLLAAFYAPPAGAAGDAVAA